MASKKQIQAQLTRSARSLPVLKHYPRHGQPWTLCEDRLLLRLFGRDTARARRSLDESESYAIAERVGRTPMAVLKRIQTLRLALHYGGTV